jgi:hypothetical protein
MGKVEMDVAAQHVNAALQHFLWSLRVGPRVRFADRSQDEGPELGRGYGEV